MDVVFSWPPLIWLGRMLGVLVLGGANVVALALLVRVLRPSNLRALAHGDLPAIRKGRFTLMGQALEVSTVAESSREDEVAVLKRQMNTVAERIDKLAGIVIMLQENWRAAMYPKDTDLKAAVQEFLASEKAYREFWRESNKRFWRAHRRRKRALKQLAELRKRLLEK